MKAREDFPETLIGAKQYKRYLQMYYAGLAMQAMLSNAAKLKQVKYVLAIEAFEYADAMIDKLEKQNTSFSTLI